MSMNPATMERVVQTRITEMRRAAVKRSGGCQSPVAPRAGRTRHQAQSRVAFPAAPRRAIGWFLVRAGLRLAMPRPRPASAR